MHQPQPNQPQSSGNASSTKIPDEWQWVKLLADEARLPNLGMPVSWEQTQQRHQQLAYEPSKGIAMDVDSSQTKKLKIGFIKTTKNKSSMPGSKTPDVVRFERYFDKKFQASLVEDEHGRLLAPCLLHGDYVQIESLQADHFQAKAGILERQKNLVNKLNNEPAFASYVMKLPGMKKFFVKTQMPGDKEEKYYGTVFFYELYFNDIDNIWLICQACNLHKSNKDYIQWLKNAWPYGKQFFDDLAKHTQKEAILKTINNKEGLAQFAIEWFWEKHATYISKSKEFYEEVRVPFMLLNEEVDHYTNEGRYDEAERLLAFLEVKQGVLEGVVNTDLEQATQNVESRIGKKVDTATVKEVKEDVASEVVKDLSDNYERILENAETLKRRPSSAAQEDPRKRDKPGGK